MQGRHAVFCTSPFLFGESSSGSPTNRTLSSGIGSRLATMACDPFAPHWGFDPHYPDRQSGIHASGFMRQLGCGGESNASVSFTAKPAHQSYRNMGRLPANRTTFSRSSGER